MTQAATTTIVAPEPPPAGPPRPWLAALLSLIPGLGHVYVGRWRAALVLLGVDTAIGAIAPIAMLRLPGAPLNIALPLAVPIAFIAWTVVDAWRSARRKAGRWNSTAYMLFACVAFAVASLLVDELLSREARARVGQAFRIPSAHMAPTLLAGDYVIAAPVDAGELRRDMVVAYRRSDSVSYVQRLVGLPGDTLAMVDRVFYRNGRAVREPWAHSTPGAPDVADPNMTWQEAHAVLRAMKAGDTTSRAPSVHNWGPLVVEPGQGFVLGDNRDNSLDSRYRGFVPLADVFARIRRIYYSRDPETGAFRWNRVGRDVPRVWEAAR